MGIKEEWNKTDVKCTSCGQVTQKARGITQENMKSLLIPKWNATEMTINILLIGILLLGYLYMSETSQAREYVQLVESGELCKQIDLANSAGVSAWQKQDPNIIAVNSTGINWTQVIDDYEKNNRTQSVSISA